MATGRYERYKAATALVVCWLYEQACTLHIQPPTNLKALTVGDIDEMASRVREKACYVPREIIDAIHSAALDRAAHGKYYIAMAKRMSPGRDRDALEQ